MSANVCEIYRDNMQILITGVHGYVSRYLVGKIVPQHYVTGVYRGADVPSAFFSQGEGRMECLRNSRWRPRFITPFRCTCSRGKSR